MKEKEEDQIKTIQRKHYQHQQHYDNFKLVTSLVALLQSERLAVNFGKYSRLQLLEQRKCFKLISLSKIHRRKVYETLVNSPKSK